MLELSHTRAIDMVYSNMENELIDQNVDFISKQAIFHWLPHRVYACRPWNARLYAAGQTRLSLPTFLSTSITFVLYFLNQLPPCLPNGIED